MEEPRKVLRAHYLGSMQVERATGIDILNDAIDQLSASTPQDQWRPVHVAVAPSMISILQPNVRAFLNVALSRLAPLFRWPTWLSVSIQQVDLEEPPT